MKRIVWLGIVLLCVTFAGCGGDDSANIPESSTDPAATGDMTGELKKAGLDPEMSAEEYLEAGEPDSQE